MLGQWQTEDENPYWAWMSQSYGTPCLLSPSQGRGRGRGRGAGCHESMWHMKWWQIIHNTPGVSGDALWQGNRRVKLHHVKCYQGLDLDTHKDIYTYTHRSFRWHCESSLRKSCVYSKSGILTILPPAKGQKSKQKLCLNVVNLL